MDETRNIITLCAPTGKAAKRMSESTGFYASTIHKAIGWSTEDENMEEFVSEKYIKSELLRRGQNLKKFFCIEIGIEEVKRAIAEADFI